MGSGVRRFSLAVIVCLYLSLLPGLSAQAIKLQVDLTDAPRNIYHAHLQIPAHAGEMALVFPKWIPGNHRPSGPSGQSDRNSHGGRRPCALWRRDDVDMYEFHVTVPAVCRSGRLPRCDHVHGQRWRQWAGRFFQSSRLELECRRAVSEGHALRRRDLRVVSHAARWVEVRHGTPCGKCLRR